jgi:hypothetical protein
MSHSVVVVSAKPEHLFRPVSQGRLGVCVIAAVDQDEHVKEYEVIDH